MATLLLLVIFTTFISMGLPSSVLGAGWTVIRTDLGAGLSAAGIINIVNNCGTMCVSVFSARLLRRFGTPKVTACSILLTASALIGYSLSPSLMWMVLLSFPLGVGGGLIDTAMTSYVALHYKAHHMSWLHGCWGAGALIGPLVMSRFLSESMRWRTGYRVLAGLQLGIAALLVLTLPLWKRKEQPEEVKATASIPLREVLKIRAVLPSLLFLLIYCGVENGVGLWGSSYLVEHRGVAASTAASLISVFYLGIMAGRLVAGVLTMRIGTHTLNRIAGAMVLVGTVILLIPHSYAYPVSIVLMGAGCSPLYPCVLQDTLPRFGEEHFRDIMSVQIGVAYFGTTLIPPLIGLLLSRISMGLLPYILIVMTVAMILCLERASAPARD